MRQSLVPSLAEQGRSAHDLVGTPVFRVLLTDPIHLAERKVSSGQEGEAGAEAFALSTRNDHGYRADSYQDRGLRRVQGT